jgi:hypothetical protein
VASLLTHQLVVKHRKFNFDKKVIFNSTLIANPFSLGIFDNSNHHFTKRTFGFSETIMGSDNGAING